MEGKHDTGTSYASRTASYQPMRCQAGMDGRIPKLRPAAGGCQARAGALLNGIGFPLMDATAC